MVYGILLTIKAIFSKQRKYLGYLQSHSISLPTKCIVCSVIVTKRVRCHKITFLDNVLVLKVVHDFLLHVHSSKTFGNNYKVISIKIDFLGLKRIKNYFFQFLILNN